MRVCRQKPPAVLAGGVFELGGMGGFMPRLRIYLSRTCNVCDGRVVKALDLKSNGIFPRRFKSCSQRKFSIF
ncbi:hypothetical protein T09_6422 [Trichinella sp. T9]|nr:hypothetical protein T09_6422 [Trichinella sp. T9]